jgi:hypothetical protein
MLQVWVLLLAANITCMAIAYKDSRWLGFGFNTSGALCCVYNILKLQGVIV